MIAEQSGAHATYLLSSVSQAGGVPQPFSGVVAVAQKRFQHRVVSGHGEITAAGGVAHHVLGHGAVRLEAARERDGVNFASKKFTLLAARLSEHRPQQGGGSDRVDGGGELFRVGRTDQEQRRGGTQVREGVRAGVFLKSNQVIAQIAHQFPFEIKIGILVFADVVEEQAETAACLGKNFREHSFKVCPGLLDIQAPALKLDRLRRHKRRRVGVLGFGGNDFENADATGRRHAEMKFAEGTF